MGSPSSDWRRFLFRSGNFPDYFRSTLFRGTTSRQPDESSLQDSPHHASKRPPTDHQTETPKQARAKEEVFTPASGSVYVDTPPSEVIVSTFQCAFATTCSCFKTTKYSGYFHQVTTKKRGKCIQTIKLRTPAKALGKSLKYHALGHTTRTMLHREVYANCIKSAFSTVCSISKFE